MSDFDDFAAAARATLDQAQAAHNEKLRVEAEERNANWARGQAILVNEVLPVVADAQRAFAKHGVSLTTETTWERGSYMAPELTVAFKAMKNRPHDVSTYEISGPSVRVTHSGDALSVVVTTGGHSRTARADCKGDTVADVSEALKIAAIEIFNLLDPSKAR